MVKVIYNPLLFFNTFEKRSFYEKKWRLTFFYYSSNGFACLYTYNMHKTLVSH